MNDGWNVIFTPFIFDHDFLIYHFNFYNLKILINLFYHKNLWRNLEINLRKYLNTNLFENSFTNTVDFFFIWCAAYIWTSVNWRNWGTVIWRLCNVIGFDKRFQETSHYQLAKYHRVLWVNKLYKVVYQSECFLKNIKKAWCWGYNFYFLFHFFIFSLS